MARWAICGLDHVHVSGKVGGGLMTRGARVDLDAVVTPATKGRPAVTLEAALGELAKHFTLEAPPARPLEGLPADVEDDTQPAARRR